MALRPLDPAAPVRLLSEDASRTGTPRLVGSLLRWLAEHEPGHPRQLVLQHGGPLLDEMAGFASIGVVNASDGPARPETVARGLDELGLGSMATRLRLARMRRAQRHLANPGLIWAHGAGALRWLDACPTGVPVVAHIHELAAGIDRSLAGLDPRSVLARPDLIVAVSQAVADHLVAERGVEPERVRVHYGWMPDLPSAASERPPGDRFAIGDDALVVGGCGTIGWRKGSDLFVTAAQLAPAVVAGRPVHWVWIGSGPAVELARLRRDIAATGLADRVHLAGEVASTAAWFDRCDIFALTSREDPFPLVALEAGAAGTPIVSFDSGGIREFLADQSGTCLAEPLHIEGLTARIEALLGDEALRTRLGHDLRARVAAHHTAETAIVDLWAEVSGRPGRTGAAPDGRVRP